MATQTQVLTFTGAEPLDGDFPYIDVTIVTPYASSSAYRELWGESVSDGNGPVALCIKDSTRTGSGFRVLAQAQFSGSVTVTLVDV